MLQIVYLSHLTSEMIDSGDQGHIDEILERAYQYNAKNNLTGILLYKGGVFLQWLEGEKEDVEKLYGKICLDLRHERITLLIKQDAEERIFEHWSMLYKKVEEIDLEKLKMNISWDQIVSDSRNNIKTSEEIIMKLLKAFKFQK